MRVFKRLLIFMLMLGFITLQSCRTWERIFPSKKRGCPTNGKNVGAEQLLDEKSKGGKAARKARRFKA